MTEPAAAGEPSRLPMLTSLRWYAALLVFLYHCLQFSGLPFLRPVGSGYVGVTFFFILSGFVLTWGAPPSSSARRFWRSRFARIYPSHVVMLIVAAAVFALVPAISEGTGAEKAAAALLLVQAWGPQGSLIGYNGLSWSLSDEAFFYLAFPLIVLVSLRRRRLFGVLVAAGLLAGLVFAWWQSRHGLAAANTAYYNPLARLPEFLLGVWLARAVRGRELPRVPFWWALALCAVLLVINWRFALPLFPVTDYIALPGFALLIVAAAQADVSRRTGWVMRFLRHRWSLYLGEVSFCFYLVHRILTETLRQVLPSGSLPEKLVWLVLALAGSLLGAALLHELVEKPARRLLLRKRAAGKKSINPQRSRTEG